jgi:anti-anti-sigma factor
MSSIVKVLKLSSLLDTNQANQIRQEIGTIVESGVQIVLMDLSDVTFIDSSGLGVLVLAFKAIRAAGGRLVLCSISKQVRMLLELTGTDQIFEVFPSQEAFQDTLLSTPEVP